MSLTPQLVRYRATGLSRGADGGVAVRNRLLGKCSRTELAEMFMRPAPKALLDKLVASGSITVEQAALALQVPLCDDVAVEADSGGHTDNRPIHVLLPLFIALRNRVHKELGFPAHMRVRVGAGGGVGCPAAALAAFDMGAAFVLTGSVNQISHEAGTCDAVRLQLSKASYSDVTMAPAADMMDEGARLQVLKKGNMFASRANKLFELYRQYETFDALPPAELERVEKRILQKSVAEVWTETKDYYVNRLHNADKIARAERDPRLKMSLCVRWYLSKSSGWANRGDKGREMDYQVWCGPAIGAFNEFAKGSYLDVAANGGTFPSVVDINMEILLGAAQHRATNLAEGAQAAADCPYTPPATMPLAR
jgi:PfaD family protein